MSLDLVSLFSADRSIRRFYQVSFLSAAGKIGLLQALRKKSLDFNALCEFLSVSPNLRATLDAWLKLGLSLKELGQDSNAKYYLRGRLARFLSQESNDPWLALVEEVSTLHHRLILETPEKVKRGQFFMLEDQDPATIARSSRGLEPIIKRFLRKQIPATGAKSLLEIGCGSGIYIRESCHLNPELTAVGLELQEPALEMAKANIRDWGLDSRVKLALGDIRSTEFSEKFDVISLHNNIYYFDTKEYASLLTKLRGLLKAGGKLLVTTGVEGGTPTMHALNLWACATRGCSPLPNAEDFRRLFLEAGFAQATAHRLIPIESYYGFVAE